MGLTITDGAKLLKNGYTLSDLKELNAVLDKNPDNGNDIVELAKKLQFSDLRSALTLFNIGGAQSNTSENNNADEDDNNTSGDEDENPGKHTPDDDHSEDDNIDYKKLYEDEKQLREKIQRSNQNRNSGNDGKPQKTPMELAMEIATDILN
jgi:hypothetical protein